MSSVSTGFQSAIKSIQVATGQTSGNTQTTTVTITSVNTAKAVVIWQGALNASSTSRLCTGSAQLTNATTVTINVASTTSADNITSYFTVVEFN